MNRLTMLCEVDDCINALTGSASEAFVEADKAADEARAKRDAVLKANEAACAKLVRFARQVLRREVRKVNKMCSIDVDVDASELYSYNSRPPKRQPYLTMTVFVEGIRLEMRAIPVCFIDLEREAKRLAACVAMAKRQPMLEPTIPKEGATIP